MIESILFCLFSICSLAGIILFPKSDSKQNLIVWISMAPLILLCVDALIAGAINLFSIPVNIVSMAIVNALLSIMCFVYMVHRKKRQQYTFSIIDLVAIVVCLAVVIICGYIQFGPELNIHYATSDPSVHLSMTLNIVNTGNVSSMYLAHFAIAMAIEVAMPFLPVTQYYMVFIICDLLFFFMSGTIFYSVVKRFANSLLASLIAIFFMLFYLLAYPLNNMVYGFCYLGVSITIVGLLCFGISLYLEKGVSNWCSILLCSLALFGLIITYALFAPFVYIATFIIFVLVFRKEGKVFCRRNWALMAVLFVPALFFGFVYTYLGIFASSELTVSGAIGLEGAIYRDLYSNFVIIGPLLVYALYHSVKTKEFSFETVLFFVLLVTMLIALLLGLFGYVSSYYFYKFYYLMWFVCSFLAVQGILLLVKTNVKQFVVAYCAVWLLVIFQAVSGLDVKINNKNEIFNPQVKSWEYLNIYRFNLDRMQEDTAMPKDLLALFERALEHQDQEEVVPLVSDWMDIYWYQAITNQPMEEFYSWKIPSSTFIENLEESAYIAVVSGSEAEALASTVIENSEIVYSNSIGYIIRVSN